MGHRRVPTIYTLDKIPNEDGLIVRMKAIKIGKIRKLVRLLGLDEDQMMEALDELFTLVSEGLVSWNLETENAEGEWVEVPANIEGIEELELPLLLSILNVWLENMTGVDEDLGKGSPSGENFPGRPLTMEAL